MPKTKAIKKVRKYPVVKTVTGTPFELGRKHMLQLSLTGVSWKLINRASKAQIRRALESYEVECDVRGFGEKKWYIAETYVHEGALHLGCMEFSAKTFAKIAKWAGVKKAKNG